MIRLLCAALAASMLCAAASAQPFVNIRSQDAPKYDPHSNTSSGMGHPMFMIGDTLVALDWDLKTVHPLLAKSWTVSDDRLTYTFALRNDVTFCSARSSRPTMSSIPSPGSPIPLPSGRSTGASARSTRSPRA